MSDLSKEQLSELVSRVTATVAKEMQASATNYGVANLRDHVSELGKVGDKVAWEVTYKTSKSTLDPSGAVINPAEKIAWEITYKTSKSTFDPGTIVRPD